MQSSASPSAWLALAAVLVLASTPASASADETSDDDAGVRSTVEEYQRVWNTHDAAAVAAFFAEDADMLFGNGPIVRGRPAIRDWWDGYFARIDEGREATFTIDSVRRIAPEVILINIDSRTGGRASDGSELPVRLARGTWVVVHRDEGWRISALRGLPAEGEVRVAPGTDR